MQTEITIALIALMGSAFGTLGGIIISSKLTAFRISELEKKMDKHNNYIERIYIMETKICNIQDNIKEMKK